MSDNNKKKIVTMDGNEAAAHVAYDFTEIAAIYPHKSDSKSVGGTGLGLAIVKHGAMIHHARVEVDSAPGEGTDFRLRFAK